MKKVLILAANGQIARIVEHRILTEPTFQNVALTLFLRHASRLHDLADNERVTLIEGDLTDAAAVNAAVAGQDMVFVGVVDHDPQNRLTKNVIAAMTENHVQRVLFTNVLGLYNEVPGEFGRWNLEMIGSGMAAAQRSDALLAASPLAYTTLRLPWLSDRDEVKYQLTTHNQPYNGVSGSRQSIADAVLQLIKDPSQYQRESLGIADPATQGHDRPVY